MRFPQQFADLSYFIQPRLLVLLQLVGQSSPQNSFQVCLRTLRPMPMSRVLTHPTSLFHTFKSTKHQSKDDEHTVLMVEYVFDILQWFQTQHYQLTYVLQINPYMSNPCHIEVVVTEADETVAKASEDAVVRLNTRQKGRLATLRQRRQVTSS